MTAGPVAAPSAPPPHLSPEDQRAYERNIPRYYVFAFLSQLQLWFPIWAAYLMLERGFSLTQIAALEAPFWLIVLLAEVPTGAIADRWGRATSVTMGAAAYAVSILVFGLASTFPVLMLSYLCWAFALTLKSGADAALLFDTLKVLGRQREYEKVAGRAMAIGSGGVLIATIAGGPLAEATTLHTPILVSSGFLVLATFVALGFREPPRLEEGSTQLSYLAGVREAAHVVWRSRTVRYLVPFAAVTAAGTMATEYLTQPFLLSHDLEVGFAFSAIQVPLRLAGMVGALAAAWLVVRVGEVRIIVAVPLVGVAAYAGLALWDSLGAISLLATLGLVSGAARPVVSGYLNRRIPSDQRATVLSLQQLVFSLLLMPIVPALGFTADKIGLPAGFAFAAVLLAVLGSASGALWIGAHRRDRLASEHAAAGPTSEVQPT